MDNPKEKRTETFELNIFGPDPFYRTLTPDTYVPVEAAVTAFASAKLIRSKVKEIIIAGTYGLKQISGARNNTGKTGAGKLCRTIKTRILSGEQLIGPVTVPPKEIRDLL